MLAYLVFTMIVNLMGALYTMCRKLRLYMKELLETLWDGCFLSSHISRKKQKQMRLDYNCVDSTFCIVRSHNQMHIKIFGYVFHVQIPSMHGQSKEPFMRRIQSQ